VVEKNDEEENQSDASQFVSATGKTEI